MEMHAMFRMNAKATLIWFAHLTNADVQAQTPSIGMEHIVVIE
jgi:hypothetical protein